MMVTVPTQSATNQRTPRMRYVFINVLLSDGVFKHSRALLDDVAISIVVPADREDIRCECRRQKEPREAHHGFQIEDVLSKFPNHAPAQTVEAIQETSTREPGYGPILYRWRRRFYPVQNLER